MLNIQRLTMTPLIREATDGRGAAKLSPLCRLASQSACDAVFGPEIMVKWFKMVVRVVFWRDIWCIWIYRCICIHMYLYACIFIYIYILNLNMCSSRWSDESCSTTYPSDATCGIGDPPLWVAISCQCDKTFDQQSWKMCQSGRLDCLNLITTSPGYYWNDGKCEEIISSMTLLPAGELFWLSHLGGCWWDTIGHTGDIDAISSAIRGEFWAKNEGQREHVVLNRWMVGPFPPFGRAWLSPHCPAAWSTCVCCFKSSNSLILLESSWFFDCLRFEMVLKSTDLCTKPFLYRHPPKKKVSEVGRIPPEWWLMNDD